MNTFTANIHGIGKIVIQQEKNMGTTWTRMYFYDKDMETVVYDLAAFAGNGEYAKVIDPGCIAQEKCDELCEGRR